MQWNSHNSCHAKGHITKTSPYLHINKWLPPVWEHSTKYQTRNFKIHENTVENDATCSTLYLNGQFYGNKLLFIQRMKNMYKQKELTLGHGSSKTRNGSVSKHRPSSFRMLGWSSSLYGFTSCKKYIWSVVVASSWRIFTTTLLVFCSGTMFWASPSTTCKTQTCHSTVLHSLHNASMFQANFSSVMCFLI